MRRGWASGSRTRSESWKGRCGGRSRARVQIHVYDSCACAFRHACLQTYTHTCIHHPTCAHASTECVFMYVYIWRGNTQARTHTRSDAHVSTHSGVSPVHCCWAHPPLSGVAPTCCQGGQLEEPSSCGCPRPPRPGRANNPMRIARSRADARRRYDQGTSSELFATRSNNFCDQAQGDTVSPPTARPTRPTSRRTIPGQARASLGVPLH